MDPAKNENVKNILGSILEERKRVNIAQVEQINQQRRAYNKKVLARRRALLNKEQSLKKGSLNHLINRLSIPMFIFIALAFCVIFAANPQSHTMVIVFPALVMMSLVLLFYMTMFTMRIESSVFGELIGLMIYAIGPSVALSLYLNLLH